ncbi:hypothetical protein TI39_contig594g00003 [Zymoseptoria brevis]|uniref:Uncharacterized protein n=1 Tax=Zymoseptoria brevis TaxID=1047168 RepID=A0A0F4GIP8_9PEZI|nr:hypothetical protein TI39_contig594g00003 [Zymoseptoria brevis]
MELRRVAVCQDCLSILRQPRHTARIFSATTQWTATRNLATGTNKRRPQYSPQHARLLQIRRLATEIYTTPKSTPAARRGTRDLQSMHARVQELCSSVLKPEDGQLPSEQRVLYVLEQLDSLARAALDDHVAGGIESPRVSPSAQQQQTAASALLGSVNARQSPASITRVSLLTHISARAEEIARDPSVFLTAAILKAYVELQSLLHQPSSFPDIFNLYANKPIPSLSNSNLAFSPSSPNKVSAAIDPNTANLALASATSAHDLGLAIDIITTSFCTKAFKRAKFLRRAALPMFGLGIAPIAAYSLSNSYSNWQQTMDAQMATHIAFAGIMTYVSAVSMVGYVAVTTANDQMDRVTWAQGVPLWERWVREEERAAIDSVAQAWGFTEAEKRGDEEGEEWDALREWVGVRGMVLDKVSLMEGME